MVWVLGGVDKRGLPKTLVQRLKRVDLFEGSPFWMILKGRPKDNPKSGLGPGPIQKTKSPPKCDAPFVPRNPSGQPNHSGPPRQSRGPHSLEASLGAYVLSKSRACPLVSLVKHASCTGLRQNQGTQTEYRFLFSFPFRPPQKGYLKYPDKPHPHTAVSFHLLRWFSSLSSFPDTVGGRNPAPL